MTPLDVIVRGGTVVVPGGPERLDVGIADGRVALLEPEIEGAAGEEVDATGLQVLPGAVDGHVHFNEPGRTHWEGWETGSAALAAGGGTLAVDMPLNAHPPTIDGAAFDLKRESAERAAQVDFALWGGLVPGSVDRLDELAERGVVGFKAFMANSGINDFRSVDDLVLYEGMARAARLGLPVAVHAESDAITRALTARAQDAGRSGVRDYLDSRPAVAELQAIARALVLAEETRCALHVVHVSTGRGVAQVAAARARGVDVTCETCPHYLVLTEDDMEELGAVAKCAPPLRPRAELDALWAAIEDGTLPMVASDHSPSPAELKIGGDFFGAWGGISGVQTTLALMLAEAHHARGLGLERVVELVAGFPAWRLGLPRKGRIEVGADADLALVDLDAAWTLDEGDLLYRHRHSPFVGRRLRGSVVRTVLRGATVWDGGRIVSPPRGRLVTPHP